MLVLIVLLLSCLIFRAIGAAGVQALASWQNSALYALTVMFVFTATAHFNKMKHDLALRCYPVSTRINHVAMMMRNVLAPLSLSGLRTRCSSRGANLRKSIEMLSFLAC
jgi:hypothetical protein